MERIFITYRTLPGVSRDDVIAFSKDVDQVVTPAQPGVLGFEAFLVEQALDLNGDEQTPSFDVIEVVDVAGFAAWAKVLERPEMAPVFDGVARLVDPTSVRMVRAGRI